MEGNLQIPFGKPVLRPPVTFTARKIKGLFCLGLYTLTEFVLNTVWTLLPLTSALSSPQKNNTAALLSAMAEGQWQTQPWPPDHCPSSWGPHYQPEVKADCFSAEHQRVFSQVHRDSGNIFTYGAILNKTWCSSTGCDQSNAHRTFWRHPSPCDPQSSRYFGCCPEQAMNNCKKSLKVQNPLFLISLQEPN